MISSTQFLWNIYLKYQLFPDSMSTVKVFFLIYLFICLFLAALGLRFFAQAFSSCGERGLLFVVVCGLLIAVASLCCRAWALGAQASVVVARGLQQLWHVGFSSCGSWALECRLSSCGAQAQLLHSMWDLPGPGLEPMSPALAGRFLTTVPPGKSYTIKFLSQTKASSLTYKQIIF